MGNRRPVSSLSRADFFRVPSASVSSIVSDWFFAPSAVWTTTWPPGVTRPNVLNVPSTYATITAACSAAQHGDIIAVAAGTYIEDVTLPVGVTLRSANCGRVVVAGQIDCQGTNTLRHITISVSGGLCLYAFGDVWCEDVEFLMASTNNGVYGDAGARNFVFRRCKFESTTSGTSALILTASLDYLEITSCLMDWRNSGDYLISPASAFTVNGTSVIANNTFLNVSTPDGIYGPFAGQHKFDFNVIHSTVVASIDGGGADYFLANYNRFTSNVGLNDTSGNNDNVLSYTLDLDGYTPRNESAVRVVDGSYASYAHQAALDYYGHPFAANRSAGAIQWQYDASALYRPRFEHDLTSATAFDFVFHYLDAIDNTLPVAEQTYTSHDEIACHVNLIVGDLTHPSRGRFYVTYDGYYRLVVDTGTFDLTLSGDADTVFGAYNQTGQTDTG